MSFQTIKLDAKNWEITDEGYIKAKAFLTRTGIFDYYEEGQLVRQFRPPEEVFDSESLKSLEMKTLTMQHPKGMVDAKTTNKYIVGYVGQDVRQEGDKVAATIMITSEPVIKHVLDLKQKGLSPELSCGYRADIEMTSGVGQEGNYDQIQRNIRYNHVSIVPAGRAGKEVKILLDSLEKEIEEMPDKNKPVEDNAVNEGVKILDEANKKIENLEAEKKEISDAKQELQAKFDAANEELVKAKEELSKWQNPESEEVRSMMDGYNKVVKTAEKLGVETKDKSIEDLKKECILKHSPGFKFDGKDNVYIDARFDFVSEISDEIATKNNNKKIAAIKNVNIKKDGEEEKEDRYKKFDETLENMHKSK